MAHAEAFLAETLTSLTHPITDFSVSVTLSGTPTAIYAPQTDAMKRKLSGFVESKAGEGFHVNVLDNRRNPEFAVLLRLYLDGKFMGHLETPTHGRRWSTPANDASRVQSFTGKRDSESTRKPFTFHPLFAAESDDEEWRPPPPEGFGTIRITVHRITDLQRVPREGNDGFKGFRGHDDDEAARKAGGGGKKAMMRHRTGFGDSQPAPRGGGSVPMKTTYKFYDRDDSPWWTFELRYLDRQMLEIRGLAPPLPAAARSPSPAYDHNHAGPSRSTSPAKGNLVKRETKPVVPHVDEEEEEEAKPKPTLSILGAASAKANVGAEAGGSPEASGSGEKRRASVLDEVEREGEGEEEEEVEVTEMREAKKPRAEPLPEVSRRRKGKQVETIVIDSDDSSDDEAEDEAVEVELLAGGEAEKRRLAREEEIKRRTERFKELEEERGRLELEELRRREKERGLWTGNKKGKKECEVLVLD